MSSQQPRFCDSCKFIPTRVTVLILVLLQGGIINYYLVKHNNYNWYAWIAGDVAVFFSFLVAFFISYRELKLVFNSGLAGRSLASKLEPGSFPLCYFAWTVYSVILTVRVALIFKNFAYKIDPDLFFGHNMLKFTVAMTALVFILVLIAHHDAMVGSKARLQIDLLTYTVPFDIIDCVVVLDIFFDEGVKKDLNAVFEWSIIGIVCVNLVLPVVPLMSLSRTRFGQRRLSPMLHTFHKLMLIFVVNAPMLVIRITLWHKQGEDISPLIVKNIVIIFMCAVDLYQRDEMQDAEPMEEVEDADESFYGARNYAAEHAGNKVMNSPEAAGVFKSRV